MKRVLSLTVVILVVVCSNMRVIGRADPVIVPFDADHWVLDEGSAFVSFGGRTALSGSGYMKGVTFLNGTIEADIWLTGQTNFPGILFRTQSFDDTEFFWLRTYKTNGLISDGIQYAPAFRGAYCWQLRPDGLGPVNVPKNEWVHMKLEVHDDAAALYVADMEKPALKVTHLGLGLKSGSAGLKARATGNVYFSNFSYRADTTTSAVRTPDLPPANVLAGWQLSPSYPIPSVEATPAAYPARQIKEISRWIAPEVDPSGLVNISKYHGTRYHSRPSAEPGKPDYAILRTFIDADRDKRVKMNFGYSDAATLFLNGKPLFSGNSAFLSRNIAYGGWISYNDAVFLDLKKGRNELLAVVAEDFGGWGFQARLDNMSGIRVWSGQK